MALHTIKRILHFGPPNADFETKFGFKASGRNFYIGINDPNIHRFRDDPDQGAMNVNHHQFFDDMVALCNATGQEKTVMLGLEPPKWFIPPAFRDEFGLLESGRNDPFKFVSDNLDFVELLAEELRTKQENAAGKLNIVLRFASEMNDRRASISSTGFNAWGQQISKFKDTYGEVRQAFREAEAHEVLFAFSPALRADLLASKNGNKKVFMIGEYFPAPADVDVISCTWYSSGSNFTDAAKHFRQYFDGFGGKGKPLAIDELGVGLSDANPQQTLDKMVKEVDDWASDNDKTFEHLTYFLDGGREADITSLKH